MQMLAIGKWSKTLRRWSVVVPIRPLTAVPARARAGAQPRRTIQRDPKDQG